MNVTVDPPGSPDRSVRGWSARLTVPLQGWRQTRRRRLATLELRDIPPDLLRDMGLGHEYVLRRRQ